MHFDYIFNLFIFNGLSFSAFLHFTAFLLSHWNLEFRSVILNTTAKGSWWMKMRKDWTLNTGHYIFDWLNFKALFAEFPSSHNRFYANEKRFAWRECDSSFSDKSRFLWVSTIETVRGRTENNLTKDYHQNIMCRKAFFGKWSWGHNIDWNCVIFIIKINCVILLRIIFECKLISIYQI